MFPGMAGSGLLGEGSSSHPQALRPGPGEEGPRNPTSHDSALVLCTHWTHLLGPFWSPAFGSHPKSSPPQVSPRPPRRSPHEALHSLPLLQCPECETRGHVLLSCLKAAHDPSAVAEVPPSARGHRGWTRMRGPVSTRIPLDVEMQVQESPFPSQLVVVSRKSR